MSITATTRREVELEERLEAVDEEEQEVGKEKKARCVPALSKKSPQRRRSRRYYERLGVTVLERVLWPRNEDETREYGTDGARITHTTRGRGLG